MRGDTLGLSETIGSAVNNWLAPKVTSPVKASLQIPGSKSQTNRALILAALAESESTLTRPLVARDTTLMCDALRQLGVMIDSTDPKSWLIYPLNRDRKLGALTLDAGLAGTVMRFILPIAGLCQGLITITGDERAKQRPIHPLLKSLRDLGVSLSAADESLPIVIEGRGTVVGGRTEIDASASSQFVSALLLAAASFEAGIELVDIGPSLPSRPHIDMTVQMLKAADVSVEQKLSAVNSTIWQIHPGQIKALNWQIEPDLSNAAPFIAAAMVTGGEIEILDWPTPTTQAGDYLRELIDAWGGSYELLDDTTRQDGNSSKGLIARGPSSLNAIDVDLSDFGELTPVVAAVCACAQGESTLRGIGHLRGHESDRLSALTQNLAAVGVVATESADALTITPQEHTDRQPGLWRSFDDHRLATAGAVIGLVTDGVSVDDIGATSKTLPNFTELWQEMIQTSN